MFSPKKKWIWLFITHFSIGVDSKQLRVTESAMKKTDSFRLHIFASKLSEKNNDSKLKANPNSLQHIVLLVSILS